MRRGVGVEVGRKDGGEVGNYATRWMRERVAIRGLVLVCILH